MYEVTVHSGPTNRVMPLSSTSTRSSSIRMRMLNTTPKVKLYGLKYGPYV